MEKSKLEDDSSQYCASLRQRFLQNQTLINTFQEQEALELLLTFVLPHQKVQEVASSLLNRYGTLNAVLNASTQELQWLGGLNLQTAILLNLPFQFERQKKRNKKRYETIKTFQDEKNYLLNHLRNERQEMLYQMCLDQKYHLQAFQHLESGSVSYVKINVSKIIRGALETNSSMVVIVHNHPSGNTTPSSEDIHTARSLMNQLEAFHITLKDFIILGDQSCTALDLKNDVIR